VSDIILAKCSCSWRGEYPTLKRAEIAASQHEDLTISKRPHVHRTEVIIEAERHTAPPRRREVVWMR
jgi:hypothetical protein